MSEAEFQRQVVELAGLYGWRTYHTFDSRRSAGGFPDLVLVKPGRPVLFAELKSATGHLTPAQSCWAGDLMDAGASYHLWRPADLQAIADLLAG